MDSFSFNHQRKSKIKMLEGREKAPFHPVSREFVRYGRKNRLNKSEKELLEIRQPIGYYAKNQEEAFQISKSLGPWLVTKEPAPLQYDDEPGVTYWAVTDGTLDDLKRINRSNIWSGTIIFQCVRTTGATVAIQVAATEKEFTIGGQDETDWVSKTIFSSKQSSFSLETSRGGKVLLDYNFIVGDRLEIDYDKRRIWLNGKSLALAINLETVWSALEPGKVTLKASHPTEIIYTEEFL
ncbi:distal tail protein Dit [Rossellomorea marisflavi]|uniref:distal tail protein Dit n=1 Tax=Rossellomorea marisflavi TaxID=189381 RepID=UPI0039BFF12E